MIWQDTEQDESHIVIDGISLDRWVIIKDREAAARERQRVGRIVAKVVIVLAVFYLAGWGVWWEYL